MSNKLNKVCYFVSRPFNPFKSILDDPFYVSLKNYNVIQVSGIIVSFYLMFYLINIYETNVATISTEAAASLFGLAGIIFTTIWVQLSSIYNNSKNEIH